MASIVEVPDLGRTRGLDDCLLYGFSVAADECAYMSVTLFATGEEIGCFSLGNSVAGVTYINVMDIVRYDIGEVGTEFEIDTLTNLDVSEIYNVNIGNIVDGDKVQASSVSTSSILPYSSCGLNNNSGFSVGSKYYCPSLTQISIHSTSFKNPTFYWTSSTGSFGGVANPSISILDLDGGVVDITFVGVTKDSIEFIPMPTGGTGDCIDPEAICCESFYFLNKHNMWEYVATECIDSASGKNKSLEYCADICDNDTSPFNGRGTYSFSVNYPVPNYNRDQFSFVQQMAASPLAYWYDASNDRWVKGKFTSATLSKGEDGSVSWESIDRYVY